MLSRGLVSTEYTYTRNSLFQRSARHVSVGSIDEKTSRDKFSVVSNLWLVGKLRQPGRAIYKDLDRLTFVDFLETSPRDRRTSTCTKRIVGIFSWCHDGQTACPMSTSSARTRYNYDAGKTGSVFRPRCEPRCEPP